MAPTTDLRELLIRSGEGELLDGDPGGTITLLADADQTGGLLTSHRSTFRAGFDGAPPHFHTRSAELFFVVDGALQVLVGERVDILRKGDLLVVPPNRVHAFAAAPDSDADVLFAFTPGIARADYYRLLDRIHRGQAGWEEIGRTSDLYDNHYAESGAWAEARTAIGTAHA